jgi:hypothetical protein
LSSIQLQIVTFDGIAYSLSIFSETVEDSMSNLQITSPTNNAHFDSKTPVTFQGTAANGIATVKLLADDRWELGSDNVDASGFWSITYPGFSQSGNRKITAIGFDNSNQQEALTSISIVVSK